MKVLAQILIAVSVTLGVLAAATAYLAPVSMGGRLAGLTLAAPAGKSDGKPIATEGTKLSPELVEQLRAGGVRYVKVKESPLSSPNPKYNAAVVPADGTTNPESPTTFDALALSRWPGKWLFVGAVGGLGLGAFLVRRANNAAVAAALRPDAKRGAVESPDEAIAGILAAIASIERDVKLHTEEAARLTVITERIGDVQKTHVDAFLQARALLQGRLGVSGFTKLMDRFSLAERQLNRAWSVAIDGVYAEAIENVRLAEVTFREAQKRLGG